MLRYRQLTQKGNRYELRTRFTASQSDLSEGRAFDPVTACGVTFDFTRRATAIDVWRWRCLPHGRQAPLPELEKIQEEINFMFNLFKSLSPYETSPSLPQDLSEIQNQPRRDPFLDEI